MAASLQGDIDASDTDWAVITKPVIMFDARKMFSKHLHCLAKAFCEKISVNASIRRYSTCSFEVKVENI